MNGNAIVTTKNARFFACEIPLSVNFCLTKRFFDTACRQIVDLEERLQTSVDSDQDIEYFTENQRAYAFVVRCNCARFSLHF